VSATATRLPIAEALPVARAFCRLIEPACHRLAIAGSIRRRATTVGDIEIVAIPKLEEERALDLFGETTAVRYTSRLEGLLNSMGADGMIAKRLDRNGRPAWGPKLKRLSFQGVPVDLFCTTARQWGLILAIRTGPAAYSHQFVTPRGQKVRVGTDDRGKPIFRMGRLPEHLKVEGGWLMSRVSGQRFETAEEMDFFNLARLEYVEPWARR
jgi:DNA polymerase/3'-5' exonuclease PolX